MSSEALPEIITRLDCGQPFEAIVGCDLTYEQAALMLKAGAARPAPTPDLPAELIVGEAFRTETGITHPKQSRLAVGTDITRVEAHALLRARCAAPAADPAEPAFGVA